jgi:hypothetical protein
MSPPPECEQNVDGQAPRAPAKLDGAAANDGASDAQRRPNAEGGTAPLSFSTRRVGSQTDEAAQQQ